MLISLLKQIHYTNIMKNDNYRLLVVEDDLLIADQIIEKAKNWGIVSKKVNDFKNVLNDFSQFNPHIVLLDIKLPFYDGFYWCNEIRKVSKVPIIFISSASENMNILMAINMGADDFISKPFDSEILIAKIKALLRRTYDFLTESDLFNYRGAIINTKNQTISMNNQEVELTKNEFKIFKTLYEERDSIVSREKLMEKLWKSELFIDENTLTVNINRLRKKLNSINLENAIETKRGQGYLLKGN